MYKIACLNAISEAGLELLDDKKYMKNARVSEAEALLVRSANMFEIDLPSNLIAVARAGAGVNNIPINECTEQGIVVFNTPGANANSVKELFVAGLLMASRDLVGGIRWVEENKDDKDILKTIEKVKSNFAGQEVKGKSIGVIGLGAVGVLVANAASDLGMKVYGYDPYLSLQNAIHLSDKVKIINSEYDIFKIADYITLHVPLIDETRGMINKNTIESMKNGVIIINLARGMLVKDNEIKKALQTGKVKKYITDFPNPDIIGVENVIALPHLGASTSDSEDNCAVMAVKELINYIENGNIRNSVNYPACDMGVCTSAVRLTINHRNIPGMISQFTSVLGNDGVNIANMLNKNKGGFAYTMIDIDSSVTDNILKDISKVKGVLKVRRIITSNR